MPLFFWLLFLTQIMYPYPRTTEAPFLSGPEQSQKVVFIGIVPLPTPGVIYLWPNTTWLNIIMYYHDVIGKWMYLKVPQNNAATKTPGIPWNLPSTSITKYGKIYIEVNVKLY